MVIGRTAREVPLDQVDDVVLGYTCANDVTGNLRLLTLDDPRHLAAVSRLAGPGVDDLVRARLVMRLGDEALWLPYLAKRWFRSTMFM